MRATLSAANLLVGSSSAPNLHARPGSGSGGRPGSGSRAGFAGGSQLRRQVKSHSAFPVAGLAKHEFGHGLGEHGLKWEDTIVTSVSGQAQKKGVRPGWKIYMIDGTVMNCSEDIWGKFQEAKWQWRSCNVWFVTDMLAIRAEAARTRANKIQAEAERLARLPFEGSHDDRHLEQVREEFKFQGYVDGAEFRAITLPQLKRIMDWAGSHCHRWRDPRTRHKLTIEAMTVYQADHWLLRPATQKKDCAFTELLTNQKQPPTWFVIQWWGEKLVDLFTCLKAHMQLRGSSDASSFWIGAFANRQHSWQESFAGLKSSAMYRAMELAQFRVLMTLDEKTDFKHAATPLTRLWCDYEAILSLDEPRTELDVAAVQSNKAVILTRGLTKAEQDAEKLTPGTGYKQKELRERAFSIDIIEKVLAVSIQKAETSDPAHRDAILKQIAGKEQDEPAAPDECEMYTKANKQLRALFALSCWRRLIAITADDSMKDLQHAVCDAIRNDSWREVLTLDFAFMNGAASEKMSLLTRALPPNVKELNLNLGSMTLTDEHVVALGIALPLGVEALDVKLDSNIDITNVGLANFMTNAPPKIRKQSLFLQGTGASKEFMDKSETLDGIKSAIYEESQKGNLCTTVNLLPNKDPQAKGRMTYHLERSKCY